jgi:alpha-mannosidase
MIFPDGNSGPLASAHFEINDKTPPIVKSVSSLASFPAAVVTFSKSMQRETAEEISNYQFDPKVMVKSATLAENGATVNLALVEPLPLNNLQLTVNGVEDTSPSANRVLPQPISVTVARPVYSLDSVSCDGLTTKRQIIPGLPVGVRDSWTLNMFVRVDKQPEDDTLIAGFGRAENKTGWGRYLLKSDTGIDFWSAHENIETSAPLDIGKWQMLTLTYDGQILIVYKNAEKIGEGAVELSEDEPILNVAPTDPWDGKQRFMGEICDLTIWGAALPQQNLKELLEKRP